MTPSQQARVRAGYGGQGGLKRASKKLRFSEKYIRRVELHGRGSDYYCQRAARLFNCNADFFFHPAAYWKSSGATAARATGGADTVVNVPSVA